MKFLRLLILFLLAPLACAPAAQAPAPRQADAGPPPAGNSPAPFFQSQRQHPFAPATRRTAATQPAADARLTELENRLNRAAVVLAPAQQTRPALYYDWTAAHGYNGGHPEWYRAAKAIASIEGMRPILLIYSGTLNNFDANAVKQYAAAWANAGVPVIMDDEGKGFRFDMTFYSPDPKPLETPLKNHLAWNRAWRDGDPKARIGHWYAVPPPIGTTDPNITKDRAAYEKKCQPLTDVNDFACFDLYCWGGMTEAQWAQNLAWGVEGAKRFGKPLIAGLCPFDPNSGAPLPAARVDRMIQACADAGIEGIFIFTGGADLSAVGDENMGVIRAWAWKAAK